MKEGIPPIETNKDASLEKKIEILHKYLESADDGAIIECLERNRAQAKELGRGNHGIVYTVEDPILGSLCVKEMIKDPEILANDPDIEFDFQDTLNTHGIKTPYTIAQVHDRETNKNYIVMERVPGFSVKDIIGKNLPLPENFDLETFIEKLDQVVSDMHGQSVIHRDLHAGNVMIDDEANPVIIDFGMSSYGSANASDAYEKLIRKRVNGIYQTTTDKGMDDRQQVKSIKFQLQKYIEGKV